MIKININSLSEDPEEYAADLKPELFDLGIDLKVLQPVKIAIKLHRIGMKVLIKGEIFATLQLMCSRCAQEFIFDCHTPLVVLAVPAHDYRAEHAKLEETVEKDAVDDSTIVPYTGEQVDLFPEICSALVLAIPMKPLCEPECPGLCCRCGKPLVSGKCSCGASETENAFAVLRKLKQS